MDQADTFIGQAFRFSVQWSMAAEACVDATRTVSPSVRKPTPEATTGVLASMP